MDKRTRTSLKGNDSKDAPAKIESSGLEFNLWLQEYQIVHSQILKRLEGDEKNYEFMMVSLGAIIAATSIVISYKAYFLLLVLSLPFHILVWDQVRKSFIGLHLSRYASEVVAPHLNAVVYKNASSESSTSLFIGWENYSPKLKHRWLVRLVRFLPKFGRTLLEFGVSIMLVIAYFLFRNQDIQYIPTSFDIVLISLNVLLIGISITTMLARVLQSKLNVYS